MGHSTGPYTVQERYYAMNNLLKDTLYYTKADSGASVDMAHGVVVGVVSALMADRGRKFSTAMRTVVKCLPSGYRPECIPGPWRECLAPDYDWNKLS